jgi:hypothetical protein
VEVGQQPPEVQGAQVGSVAVLLLREVEAVEGQEAVLQTTVCILEPWDHPAPVVQLAPLPITAAVVVVVLAPIPTTMEITGTVPQVELVAVAVVPTTRFVKADSP